MSPVSFAVPISRILSRLDEYLVKNEYSGAEQLLSYWLLEAEAVGDRTGALTILNEQIGLYRKTEKEAECMAAAAAALERCRDQKIEKTVMAGTTLINAATGYKAFGKAGKALPLYREAKEIYEALLSGDDGRLAGLYNNMALALSDLKEFREAEELDRKALKVLSESGNAQAEMAITYLNMADLAVNELGIEKAEEQITPWIEEAERLLDLQPEAQRDGNYAYACEKCAPVFGYYGYFAAERKFRERADRIRSGL